MDPKDTRTQTLDHKTLTLVGSGAVCRLIGVAQGHWGFRHSRWGSERRGHHGRGSQGKTRRTPLFGGRHKKSQHEVTRRLLDLGLTKGCTFKVVQSSRFGPVLVEVRGTRIALGHGLASRLIVEEVGV